MSNYNIKLTPNFIDPTTEGSLDSSILNGKSLQRTFNMYEVDNYGARKMISVKDGDTFNDTTFQNSTATGTFEAGLTFTASQILDSDDSHDENGFVGGGAIIGITSEQADALNSYGYPSLFFTAIWAAGSENLNAALNIFAIDNMYYSQDDAFVDIAVIIPFNAENMEPYCTELTTWNMPVTVTGFMFGNNNNGVGFMEGASDPHIIHKLFKQVASQQEIDLEGKTPQEKADLIRTILEGLSDDHPLVANMRRRQS
jgi:hypothetical protein